MQTHPETSPHDVVRPVDAVYQEVGPARRDITLVVPPGDLLWLKWPCRGNTNIDSLEGRGGAASNTAGMSGPPKQRQVSTSLLHQSPIISPSRAIFSKELLRRRPLIPSFGLLAVASGLAEGRER